jgi:hypothetical protein
MFLFLFARALYLKPQNPVNALRKLWKLWKLFYQTPINIDRFRAKSGKENFRRTLSAVVAGSNCGLRDTRSRLHPA